jgi:hypothetical protein
MGMFHTSGRINAFSEDAMARISPDSIRKKGKVPKNASIFFTIFQTFLSGLPKDGKPSPYFGEYPPDFFDFVISYCGLCGDEKRSADKIARTPMSKQRNKHIQRVLVEAAKLAPRRNA